MWISPLFLNPSFPFVNLSQVSMYPLENTSDNLTSSLPI
jgi:hypothetical protein